MRFIGIDLAWQSDKNHTGAVVLAADVEGATLRRVSSGLGSLDAVVNFIMAESDADTVVAIDAPLIIENLSGQRPCETEIGRLFGRHKASAHTSNRTLYPDPGSVRLTRVLQQNGFLHNPNPTADRRRQGRWFFEVYPHPAHVVLFNLPERLLYKKGTAAEKRAGLARYRSFLRGLPDAMPPIRPSEGFEQLLSEPLYLLKGRALKHYEDKLDALLCAYLALYYWTWGSERNCMVGDTVRGYIINPTHPLRTSLSSGPHITSASSSPA